jgi:hypothetical protein
MNNSDLRYLCLILESCFLLVIFLSTLLLFIVSRLQLDRPSYTLLFSYHCIFGLHLYDLFRYHLQPELNNYIAVETAQGIFSLILWFLFSHYQFELRTLKDKLEAENPHEFYARYVKAR